MNDAYRDFSLHSYKGSPHEHKPWQLEFDSGSIKAKTNMEMDPEYYFKFDKVYRKTIIFMILNEYN